jgi:hypothetical protein
LMEAGWSGAVLHARARRSTVQQQSRSASQWKNLTQGGAQHFQPSKCRSQSMSITACLARLRA